MKRRILSLVITLVMVLSLFSFNAIAAAPASDEVQTIVVDFADVVVANSTLSTTRTTTVQHRDHRAGTGARASIPETFDLRNVLPANSTVVSITVHVPTNITVTRSQFTAIQNFVITRLSNSASTTLPFAHTNTPGASNKTTFFNNVPASDARFSLQITGTTLSNVTGLDGFTVFPGARFIVEYR